MSAAAPTEQQAATAAKDLSLRSISREIWEAEALVTTLGDSVSFYKIGLELACGSGLPFAQDLIKDGKEVFLDLSCHDIATTVGRALVPRSPLSAPSS